MKRTLATMCVLATLASARVAAADGADEEAARAAMERGVAAFGRGESEIALTEYESAKRLVPLANAPYLYAAEALVALARYPEAVANLERYIAMKPDVSDADEVTRRIARIKAEHYPARVRVTPDANAVVVEIDGAPGDRGLAFEVAPGRHRLDLRSDGREPTTTEVEAVGDREVVVTVHLPIRQAPVQPPPQARPTPWATVGWLAMGVGAATLTTAILLDAAVLGPKITDYRSAADRSDPSARDLRSDATTLRGWTIASYVTGGVLAAGGIGLLVFAPRTRAVEVAPWMTLTAGGVGVRGRFLD